MTASITGNLELGRINIEGQNYVTVKIDRDGGPMLYEHSNGSTAEILFCRTGEDLGGHDPNKCLRLDYGDGNYTILVTP